jgi:hypothetical protein
MGDRFIVFPLAEYAVSLVTLPVSPYGPVSSETLPREDKVTSLAVP